GVTRRAEEEGPGEADAVGDGPAEEAEEAHEAEDEGVSGVDEEGLLGAAGAELVHGVPEAGGHEAYHADHECVEEGRAVPGALDWRAGELRLGLPRCESGVGHC